MKNLVKPGVITFLTGHPVSTIADRFFHNSVPIFMLHRISRTSAQKKHGITADHLRNCLEYLVDQDYTFVSLENLINVLNNQQKLPIKSVIFTMDDGYNDQAEIALPIVLEYSCPITLFVITGMLDLALWPWDAKVSWIIESSTMQSLKSSATIKKLYLNLEGNVTKKSLRRSIQGALKKLDSDLVSEILWNLANDTNLSIPKKPPPEFQPMTWDMARTLEDQGVQFAPHSTTHKILSRLDQISMEQEITGSWDKLKNELKNPLKIFCYPNGTTVDFGNREIAFLKESGFLGAVSTFPSVVKYKYNSNNYTYSLPRLSLPDNMPEFIQYCSWIERARSMIR